MGEYVRVFGTESVAEANKYIEKGWELISPSTAIGRDGGEYVWYSLGLTARKQIDDLLSIIKDYERYGFKDSLMKKIAEEYNDDLASYQADAFYEAETPLTKYLSKYESTVNKKEITFSNKHF